ncbi:MAG: glycosyltransferase family 39 protein, partial [candidate division WOR-3 bacterium]
MPKTNEYITSYVWRIVLVGSVIYALFYIIVSFIVVTYPYQLSYGEGFILNQAALITRGESIYQDITTSPFIVSNYPPVYPYLCALLVKLCGVSFSIGRFISALATLLCGIIIYRIIKKTCGVVNGHVTRPAFVGFLFFLASPFIYNYYPLFRVDALALLFSLLGLYCIFVFEDRTLAYISIPFFILALYTKQNFIAAPIATFIYLLFKNIKRGFGFAILFCLAYATIFLLLTRITRGQFYLHTIVYNANPFSILSLFKFYISALQVHAFLFGFAFAYVIHGVLKKNVSLFILYFILAACTALSVGKIGSNLNYFGEMVAASCILLGMLLTTQVFSHEKDRIVIMTGLVLQLILFIHIPFVPGFTPTQTDLNDARKVSAIINTKPDPILSENSGLLVVNKRIVVFQPFICTQLANQGSWDQKP